MAYYPPTGSVVAFQSDPSKFQASVTGVVGISGTPSISGTVNIGNTVPVSQSGAWTHSVVGTVFVGGSVATVGIANQSVSGTVGASVIGNVNVTITSIATVGAVMGSVTALQGTNPWIITGSVQASITPAANQSVSGTVGASVIGNVNVTITSIATAGAMLGSITAIQGTLPWTISSVYGNIGGSVVAFQGGTQVTSLVSTIPSSVMVGASIFGQLPAGTAVLGSVATLQGTNPWIITGSVQGAFSPAGNQSVSGTVNVGNFPTTQNVSGSVVAFQGGTTITSISGTVTVAQSGTVITSVVNTIPSSMLVGASIIGTVPVVQSGTMIVSVVGGFAEDSAHTSGDPAVFVVGVRNDAIASTVNANLDYTAFALDSAGRSIIKPFVSDDATLIEYVGSVVSGSVTLIKASALGKKNYITDFVAANTGATTTLLTFQDGSTSIIGYTIVPTGGGSNATGFAIPFKTANAQDLAFKVSPSSSVVYLTVRGYQAP